MHMNRSYMYMYIASDSARCHFSFNISWNRWVYLVTKGINKCSKHWIVNLSILLLVHFGHNAIHMVQNIIEYDKQTGSAIPPIPARESSTNYVIYNVRKMLLRGGKKLAKHMYSCCFTHKF